MTKVMRMAALMATVAALAPIGANARIGANGLSPNGIELQGTSFNGANLNGMNLQGTSFNGHSLNGSQIQGTGVNGLRLNAIIGNGVALKITSNGRIAGVLARLRGTGPAGARPASANASAPAAKILAITLPDGESPVLNGASR